MPISIENIISYVTSGISILLAIFCLFKVLNTSRKINSLADFIHGEVFSVRFESLLTTFFSKHENVKHVMDILYPVLKDYEAMPIIAQTNKEPLPQVNDTSSGLVFVD